MYEVGALGLCLSVAGSPDNLLFGSDYPHNIGDMAGCLARVRTLPEDQARRITHKNAERLFKL
jgi:aminocarboxymuconate-semialdehyde decarboxylase